MIYDYKENIYAGGSGPACMPLVVYSSIIPKMKQRIIKKVLLSDSKISGQTITSE